MVVWDPGLVVVLAGNSSSDASRLGARKGIASVNGSGLLALLGGTGSLGLGEESLDPGLVDEVESTGEGSSEENVEEDAKREMELVIFLLRCFGGIHGRLNIHLGVEEAGRGLDNGGSLVISLELVDSTLGVGDDSNDLEEDILGLHILGESKGQLLLGASRNLEAVLDGRQVAHDALVSRSIGSAGLGGDERAANHGDGDGLRLMVGDLDEGLGRSAVDELHTKDVSVGEGRLGIGGELRLGDGRGTSVLLMQDSEVSN